jgi:hypothetical protein
MGFGIRNTEGFMLRNFILLITMAVAGMAQTPLLQAPRSPSLAAELIHLLAQHGLDSVAAADPASPDRFVAAMAFPNVQLLVVSAKYPSPSLLQQQLAAKAYRDVYLALQQSGVAGGKIFIQDLHADGLRPDPSDVDVVYENVVTQTVFDADPQKHGLTQAAYDAKLQAMDAQYSHLLTLLIGELKPTTSPQP